jgi:hypothetical protein
MTKMQPNALRGSQLIILSLGKCYTEGGASGVLMKCILSTTGKQLLDEVHAGQYGIHAASRTLVGKVFRSGFYWPTTKSDAVELV